ncbi:hypothetical protein FAI41_03785 [Acetobacteraceae bacterium]|nr:hypothetical protein FAI41_03785 [Acetobacteraceae bacterium]
MTTSSFDPIRHQLLDVLEDVYPSPLALEDVALSAPFDPYDSTVLEILYALQEEGLTTKNSVQKEEDGRIIWHQPAITSRGIDYLASHSNMSHTLEAGTQRVQEACLQPILKEALLLTEALSMEEKKAYFERIKKGSEADLLEIAKELEAKDILKHSNACF